MRQIASRSNTGLQEVDEYREFDRRMQRQIEKGHRPRVQVVIQVRHKVSSIAEYRAKLAKLFRGFRKRGVPEDERPEILEQVMAEGPSREWTDVEVFWDGLYRRGDVKLPVREKLDEIEDKYEADKARVRVRARI